MEVKEKDPVKRFDEESNMNEEGKNLVARFDDDLKWYNDLWFEGDDKLDGKKLTVSDKNKLDIAKIIYGNSENEKNNASRDTGINVNRLADCFSSNLTGMKMLFADLRRPLLNIENQLKLLQPIKWWQFWKFIKRYFINKEKKNVEANINSQRNGYYRSRYEDIQTALSYLDEFVSKNKDNKPKDLLQQPQQNEINKTNNDKIHPISKVVNENKNMEMTDEKKHNEDYIGCFNRINGKGKKNQEQNIDERNKN